MFNNILSSLTSLLPKNFIFGSFVPIIIFGFINGALLYQNVRGIRAFVNAQTATPIAFDVLVAFVASVVAAYVLSAVSSFLRDFLEGKYVWPRRLDDAMRASQERRLDEFDSEYEFARQARDSIASSTPRWREELRTAANAGAAAPTAKGNYDRWKDEGGRAVGALREMRNSGRDISYANTAKAVSQLSKTLTAYSKVTYPDLEKDQLELLILIDYAAKAARAWELRAYAQRQSMFGLLTPMPTRMGNVAAALQSYTVTRYGFDLDTFWSRLQCVLQKSDDKSSGSLLDAKTQLDFLIACCWLAALTTIGWFVALAGFGASVWVFAVVALAGPAVVYALYSLAVTNYLSYAELVRAYVDLNRFTLLKTLHIALPSGIREERLLWSAMRRLSSFGEEGVELSYEHPAT